MALVPQRVGIEQQINATTRGPQVLARFAFSAGPAQLASLPNGVVAVYEGSPAGVYMRIVYSDGSLSPEVFVDGAVGASVAALANGDIMVVFDEDQGGRTGNIMAKLYNADLTPKQPAWFFGIVKGYSPNLGNPQGFLQSRVFAPSIVSLNRGDFFGLIWHESRVTRPRTRLRCRFLHPPRLEPLQIWDLKWGSDQYHFNTTNHFAPLDHGGFVYVRRSDDGSLSIGVFNMQDQRTGETNLNVKGTFPCIAADHPYCIVAWRNDADGDIYFAPVSVSDHPGAPPTAVIGVLTKANQEQGDVTRPAIAFLNRYLNSEYLFVVTWENTDTSGRVARSGHASHAGHAGIKARAFGLGNGNWLPESDEFYVNSTQAGRHAAPSIAPTATGGFYAIWMANSSQGEDDASADKSDWGIKGQEWSFLR